MPYVAYKIAAATRRSSCFRRNEGKSRRQTWRGNGCCPKPIVCVSYRAKLFGLLRDALTRSKTIRARSLLQALYARIQGYAGAVLRVILVRFRGTIPSACSLNAPRSISRSYVSSTESDWALFAAAGIQSRARGSAAWLQRRASLLFGFAPWTNIRPCPLLKKPSTFYCIALKQSQLRPQSN